MTTHLLRFFRDSLEPNATVELPGNCTRVVYLCSGTARLRSPGFAAGMSANSAFHGASAFTVIAGPTGAQLHRWELVRAGQPVAGTAMPLLVSALALDAATRYLVRCDRVDFPPGGIAYTHTHRGGGVRCLIAGTIRIDVPGATHEIGPGEPWFEAGPDPVLATASASEDTSFSRVMILPLELLGRSSIRYVLPEDQDKPKRQSYQLFIDEPIET
jgi:hypothetical protein